MLLPKRGVSLGQFSYLFHQQNRIEMRLALLFALHIQLNPQTIERKHTKPIIMVELLKSEYSYSFCSIYLYILHSTSTLLFCWGLKVLKHYQFCKWLWTGNTEFNKHFKMENARCIDLTVSIKLTYDVEESSQNVSAIPLSICRENESDARLLIVNCPWQTPHLRYRMN